MKVFFTANRKLTPERVLKIYGARFKIEELFWKVKTNGGL